MEFWACEVKSGESIKHQPGKGRVLCISQASLGEVEIEKGNVSVCLFANVDGKKIPIGTLSSHKFPQLLLELIFDRDFELSHNWEDGSVYFFGHRCDDTFHPKLGQGAEKGNWNQEWKAKMEELKAEREELKAKGEEITVKLEKRKAKIEERKAMIEELNAKIDKAKNIIREMMINKTYVDLLRDGSSDDYNSSDEDSSMEYTNTLEDDEEYNDSDDFDDNDQE